MPIDAEAYPHILDLIVSHAPPASLAVLRGVSRDLRTRADALLFKHISVEIPPTISGFISIRAVGTSVTLPWVRYGPGSQSRDPRRHRYRKYVHHLAESARCIDRLVETFLDCADARASEVIDALSKISFKPAAHVLFRELGAPAEAQDFYDLDGATRHRSLCNTAWLQNRQFAILYDSRFILLPESPRRTTQCLYVCAGVGDSFELPECAMERVLHLLRAERSPTFEGDLKGKATEHVLGTLVFLVLMGSLYEDSFDRHLTVIGGGEEMRTLLGLARAAPRDKFEAALDEYIAHVWWQVTKRGRNRFVHALTDDDECPPELEEKQAAGVAYVRRLLHFLTPDEYVELVSMEQVVLETQVDPTAGLPAYLP